ncbi:transposase [Cohnella faecalis]|uniref:Transposase n=1 Tax=Cohnella faecalis TaxID=2315694 RepID=A0A398CSH1_9BACL|nr:transposase [Cohnella faecalis]RIE04189.1 transposase [Cohnella faecalis]
MCVSSEDISFDRVRELFNDEQECVKLLFASKWPDGFRCPSCAHRFAYVITTRRMPLYECKACRTQTSLQKGTILEGSRTPLRVWFQAIFLLSRPDSVNAVQLSNVIGVTYKTGWLMYHKIRFAMSDVESRERLSGIVRITDAVYGQRFSGSRDWDAHEQPLFIGSSESETGKITRIIIKKQPEKLPESRFSRPSPAPFLDRYVDPEFEHQAIVSYRFDRQKRNYILLDIASKVEHWLADTFNGIGPKHLDAYLDQFCYMWNRQDQPLFLELIRICAITPTITYPLLTRSSSGRSSRSSRPSTLRSARAS